MIHYALRCGTGHEFDGWFQNSASFEAQAAGGLLTCPACGESDVGRAIMAPRLNKGGHRARTEDAPKQAPEAPPPALPDAAPAPKQVPDEVRAVLQRIRADVEKHCDYVGDKFAATARRIHTGVEPHRPIYGEATQAEAADLADDGIAVSRIPWVPRADS